MGLELDWLEREERYRRRVLRMLIVAVVVVGAFAGTAGFLRARAIAESKVATTRRAEAERAAAKKRQRDAFVADSSATTNRYTEFNRLHGATPIEGVPLLSIPLPPGASVPALVQRLWTEYARVADPQVSARQESDWFRQFYVDVMNDGPLRGRAVLLPSMKQDGTKFTIQKPSFFDITHAQIEIGMRETPKDATAESLAVRGTADAAAASDAGANNPGSEPPTAGAAAHDSPASAPAAIPVPNAPRAAAPKKPAPKPALTAPAAAPAPAPAPTAPVTPAESSVVPPTPTETQPATAPPAAPPSAAPTETDSTPKPKP